MEDSEKEPTIPSGNEQPIKRRVAKLQLRLILVIAIVLAGAGLLWSLYWQIPVPSTPPAAEQSASTSAVSQVQPEPAPVRTREAAPAMASLETAKAALEGRVITEQELSVPGASVYAYHADLGVARVVADEAGNFVFPELPEGEYRVSAHATGFNEAVLEGVQHGSRQLRMLMSPLSSVVGRAVEAGSGLPIPAFDVRYLDFAPADGVSWQEVARMDTGEWQSVLHPAGEFVLDGVASGKPLAVVARAEGYAPASAELDPIEPGETSPTVTLALGRAAGVDGRVVDGLNRPIEGVAIHLGDDARKPIQDFTDSGGRFRLSDLATSPIVLTASHPRFIDQTVEVSPATPPAIAEIVLAQGGRIEGGVFLKNAPLTGVLVVAGYLGPDGFHKRTSTDTSGRFSIAGIPPGEAEVFADRQRNDGECSQLQQRVLVEEGRVSLVEFRFPETASTLEGVISVHRRPPASATVIGTIVGEAGDAFFSSAAGDDGAYRASGLAPGEAWIEVEATTASGAERRKSFGLTITEGTLIHHDILLGGSGVLTGTVVGLEEGDIGDVMLYPADYVVDTSDIQALLELESVLSARAKIQSDGRFRLNGLDPGSYSLFALVFRHDSGEGADMMSNVWFASAPVVLHTGEKVHLDLSLTR